MFKQYPCTIVHVRGTGFISKSIRWFTRGRGEEKTESNHVGIYLTSNTYGEITFSGGKLGSPEKLLKNRGEVRFSRPLTLSLSDQNYICRRCSYLIETSRGYGWSKIFTHTIDGTLAKLIRKDVVLARKLNFIDTYPICAFISIPFDEIGLDFGVKARYASPDDILDFQLANPDKYLTTDWIPV